MANPEHLKILKQGVEVWNKWREENPEVRPDLSEEDFNRENLIQVNFCFTNLSRTDLSRTNLFMAKLVAANVEGTSLRKSDLTAADLRVVDFSKTDLRDTVFHSAKLTDSNFRGAYLLRADLSGQNLRGLDFSMANLSYSKLKRADVSNAYFEGTNFEGADLEGINAEEAKFKGARFIRTKLIKANLIRASLFSATIVETDLSFANLEKAFIYGISAWDIKKDGLIQKDLIITPPGEPEITVDDLEVAQFIYLMLNNEKIRDVIETITSKAVLILGRFTPERKAVLDALKDELRRRNYLPIVFDFENAGNKSVDETVNLLARMSRFVVADITDAKSIPQELRGIVPDNPTIPIVPLIWKEQREYGMFDFFRGFPWVLNLHEYESPEILLENIIPAIITPAEQKVAELRRK